MPDKITFISSIADNDAGGVATLHRALIALGFKIDDAEHTARQAGKTTVLAVRAIQRAARLTIDDRMLLSAEAAAEINRRLVPYHQRRRP